MIFVDSNIPMYLLGGPHPNKARARELLERLVGAREKLVTDAEIFQELLHRYVAIGRTDAIEPTWDALASLADEVFPIEIALVARARELVLESAALSARDALHLAVMEAHAIGQILTFDRGFDEASTVRRIS